MLLRKVAIRSKDPDCTGALSGKTVKGCGIGGAY